MNNQNIELNRFVFNDVKDFDLVHLFECGQCFRWVPFADEDAAGDTQTYTGVTGDKAAKISYTRIAGSATGTLVIEATGGSEEFWMDYLDLDNDYGEIKRTLIENEPLIKPATEYGQGIRILNQDLFETIISFIISQNNNIPRIRKNIESLCRRYGEKIEGCDIYAFPTPERLAEAEICDLAELKLGYRCEYIKASAAKFLAEGRPHTREELLSFHGIGPKVANCIMLFGLRDTAAFPVDTWVKHIMNDMYGFDSKDIKGMQTFATEHFGNLAGYAQQYLFYYYRDRS